MQLALLIGANPKIARQGPVVRLPAGSWRFVIHGLNSSILSLHTDTAEIGELARNSTFNFGEGVDVHVKFKTRGVEDYLTVIAESQ